LLLGVGAIVVFLVLRLLGDVVGSALGIGQSFGAVLAAFVVGTGVAVIGLRWGRR
jgi:hypothetical protein